MFYTKILKCSAIYLLISWSQYYFICFFLYILLKRNGLLAFQLEYGNKELMTNMESSGSEVNTLRKYYVPGQYIQEATNNLDFLEVCPKI